MAAIPDAGPDQDAALPMTVRTLITLGSSSTAGSGASLESTRYVNLLAGMLGARLVNLGTGGQQMPYVEMTALPQALAALDAGVLLPGQVDVVTFLPLTDFQNSNAAQLAAGYGSILARLDGSGAWVAFGIPTVDEHYACGARGDLRGPDGECYPGTLVDEYAAKQAAVEPVVRQHPNMAPAGIPQLLAQHPEWVQPDGHPNDPGHLFIAQQFYKHLAPRLGWDAGM